MRKRKEWERKREERKRRGEEGGGKASPLSSF